MLNTTNSQSVPSHVPAGLVREIDVFNVKALHKDLHLAWKRVQDENPPIFYTPLNGGHWIMTRAPLIERLFSEPELFASRHAYIPPLPPGIPEQLPINSDGKEHRAYRSFIMPFLVTKQLAAAISRARELAVELIAGLKDKGECDFMADFAEHLPIQIFLDMVDLPLTDRPILLRFAELVRINDPEEQAARRADMMAYLNGWIEKRIEDPGEDLISKIVTGKVGDRPVTRDEMMGECMVVLLGGLDTVASMMGFIANFLAREPEVRRRLAQEPALIPRAIDELMRRFGVAAPCRRVTRDAEVDGVALKEGDVIYLGSFFHGLDEKRWKDSLIVDLDRRVENPQTFGGDKGPHRCPGAGLARAEVTIFLEEWLKHIPDFRIKEGSEPQFGSGAVNGVHTLQLQWNV